MKVVIHRGQNQIGGSIIEVSTENTKIVFDVGVNLSEDERSDFPNIQGLFQGECGYDAVFISHYHADHVGLGYKLIEEMPVYMGKNAYQIMSASNAYRYIDPPFVPKFIQHRKSVFVKDVEIIPFLCDHSAYDSYMFLIKGDEKTILYTGDFRANGRMDYSELLNELPTVDLLIVEGTNLTRPSLQQNIPEKLLEDIATNELRRHKGPCFVLMSAMNIERLITIGNVAQNTDRMLLEDLYTAQIVCAVEQDIPKPDRKHNVRVFVTDGRKERYEQLRSYGSAKIGRNAIVKQSFIMCVRPSMQRYLEKLNQLMSFEDGVLFYGMWKGYQKNEEVSRFLDFMREKGVKVHVLHTSGHADESTIEKLIADVEPRIIMPIHTENAEWFNRYEDEIEIIYGVTTKEI